MNFAKLFQYQTGQLLVTIDKDYSPDEVTIKYRSDTADLSVEKKKAKTEDIEAGVKRFEEFNEPEARETFDGMQKLMQRM